MRKSTGWFAKNTQQAVMSRASTLPVLARTGPNSKSGGVAKTGKDSAFIVGESEVGGDHLVGETP